MPRTRRAFATDSAWAREQTCLAIAMARLLVIQARALPVLLCFSSSIHRSRSVERECPHPAECRTKRPPRGYHWSKQSDAEFRTDRDDVEPVGLLGGTWGRGGSPPPTPPPPPRGRPVWGGVARRRGAPPGVPPPRGGWWWWAGGVSPPPPPPPPPGGGGFGGGVK